MNRPEVTVVVPSRNRWPLLDRAVSMVLGQRDVAVELVVVNDGSRDETPVALERIEDPRLRVLHQLAAGVARARNAGIAEARGRWIAFMDDDDLWSPCKLVASLAVAQETGRPWVYGTTALVDGDLRFRRMLPLPEPEDLAFELHRMNVIGGPSAVMVKADFLAAAGGFDQQLSLVADWDLWLRLIAREMPAACHEAHVAYVAHESSMHVVDAAKIPGEIAYLRSKHASRSTPVGDPLLMARWVAVAHRRGGRRWRAVRDHLATALRHRSPRDMAAAAGTLLGERMTDRIRARLKPSHEPPQWLRACELHRPGRTTS